jgi:hypothetical protein
MYAGGASLRRKKEANREDECRSKSSKGEREKVREEDSIKSGDNKCNKGID